MCWRQRRPYCKNAGWYKNISPYGNPQYRGSMYSSQKKIPRNNVTTPEILKVGQVETHYFKSSKICNQPCFELLNLVKSCDATRSLGDLWNCAWLLKPHMPVWNGLMQMIQKGVIVKLIKFFDFVFVSIYNRVYVSKISKANHF